MPDAFHVIVDLLPPDRLTGERWKLAGRIETALTQANLLRKGDGIDWRPIAEGDFERGDRAYLRLNGVNIGEFTYETSQEHEPMWVSQLASIPEYAPSHFAIITPPEEK